jgi:uncharacterized repeat protein (TIGR02543 family)
MKKIIVIFLTLIVILTGCSMFIKSDPNQDPITITFQSNGGSIILSVTTNDTKTYNFNTTHIPTKEHYTFDGWYKNEALTTPYVENEVLMQSITLYAKWIPASYELKLVYGENANEYESYYVAYGDVIPQFIPERLGHEFLYWYESDEEIAFEEHMPGHALTLYAKWLLVAIYHQVSFELNGSDTVIGDLFVDDGTLLIPPLSPSKEGFVFAGWMTDSSLTTPFDFETPVTHDLTLYAKWSEAHTVTDHNYSLDGDHLIWDEIPDALYYDVYIGEHDVPYTVENESFDLRPHEARFEEPTLVEVYVIFNYNEVLLLFDVLIEYQNHNIAYQTGFETEHGFSHSQTYNNQSPVTLGNSNYQFSVRSGTVSQTNKITGELSLEFRWYTTNPNTISYAQNINPYENISYLTFSAKSSGHHVMVNYSIDDGTTFINDETFALTTQAQEFTYNIEHTGAIIVRFTLVVVSKQSGRNVVIDDLKLYSRSLNGLFKIVPKVEDPIADEDALNAIKLKYQSDRNKLAAPEFSIPMSNEELINYYASLNGLSGEQFRTELRQILTTTHRRLTSYNEARFILEQSDLVEEGELIYLDGIYSGHKIIRYWDGGATWAREHVWPNSKLGVPRVEGSDKNIASDVHNLRAINPGVNTSRLNRYFAQGLTVANGTVGTKAYYPGDKYKGDVARILFYMAARYSELTLRNDNLDAGDSYTLEGAVMGILDDLIRWHSEDPVDAFELRRNDIIYSYQGVRNPFIDHPEYVAVYYGN